MGWIIFIGFAIVSYLIQANLKSKFERYSEIPVDGGLTGRDVAVKMLRDNGIYDVQAQQFMQLQKTMSRSKVS